MTRLISPPHHLLSVSRYERKSGTWQHEVSWAALITSLNHQPYSPSLPSLLTILTHHPYSPSLLTILTHHPYSPSLPSLLTILTILTHHPYHPYSPSLLTISLPVICKRDTWIWRFVWFSSQPRQSKQTHNIPFNIIIKGKQFKLQQNSLCMEVRIYYAVYVYIYLYIYLLTYLLQGAESFMSS